MNEQQLLYFSTIVKTGSFSEAALELDMSQSSISRQIISLEDELGVTLFSRKKRKIELTDAGSELFPQAEEILAQMQSMKRNARSMHLAHANQLTILSLPISGYLNIYELIRRFETEHADASIRLLEIEEPALFSHVNKDDFQIALTYPDSSYLAHPVSFLPVLEDELVLAVPLTHPLAVKQALMPQDLNDVELMLMEKHTCICHQAEAFIEANHLTPQIIHQGRPESILGAVSAGHSCALLSRIHTGNTANGTFRLLPFQTPVTIPLGYIISHYAARQKMVQDFTTLPLAKI